ncbi:hypothetical protein [Microbacterium murale]|uniref:Multisubunit Na+/H+ antiporter MnhE subunit n=1 Tax=Microbacterium murale TaxID=1081040 RepID=A0ABU0P5K6_9MICO|nr:hypothetical protein [Microbacterium murale]MDQ0642202.1 multisubunit Na+/H+ antiporter MnhE subunit [Microbacterium murale]
MNQTPPQPRRSEPNTRPGGSTAWVRIVGAVLTLTFGIPFVILLWMVLSSRFGAADVDPHGYVLIFGTFAALVTGLAASVFVPLLFRRQHRSRAMLLSMGVYVVIAVLLLTALITA